MAEPQYKYKPRSVIDSMQAQIEAQASMGAREQPDRFEVTPTAHAEAQAAPSDRTRVSPQSVSKRGRTKGASPSSVTQIREVLASKEESSPTQTPAQSDAAPVTEITVLGIEDAPTSAGGGSESAAPARTKPSSKPAKSPSKKPTVAESAGDDSDRKDKKAKPPVVGDANRKIDLSRTRLTKTPDQMSEFLAKHVLPALKECGTQKYSIFRTPEEYAIALRSRDPFLGRRRLIITTASVYDKIEKGFYSHKNEGGLFQDFAHRWVANGPLPSNLSRKAAATAMRCQLTSLYDEVYASTVAVVLSTRHPDDDFSSLVTAVLDAFTYLGCPRIVIDIIDGDI